MAQTQKVDTEVVIVGFGPVGKLLSIQLSQQGHRVTVIDRQSRGFPLPRAVTHDSEFARILQSIGLPPDTISNITQPYDDMYVWRNGAGDVLVEVDWSGLGPSGWYNTYFFNQPDLEDRLDQMISALPGVTVMREWEVTDHGDHGDHVSATLADCSGSGQTQTITASYLIGADGAGSKVRQRMGSAWNDLGYFFDWLVVDVQPDPALNFPHVATQTCDIARPCTMVPGGPGRRRWEFMRLPDETALELNQTPKAWELLAPYGLTADNSVLERHSVYTFQAAWAETWRVGRVMIAGDAAHLMPPFAGQGLGAGFRDAVNLAWKLDRVLAGTADDSLLDTYGPERKAHVRAFIDFSTSLGQVICITDPAEAAERDERMMREWADRVEPPAPPQPTLGDGAHHGPHGGTLSPQGWVHPADSSEPSRLDDIAHGRSLLIARASAQLDAQAIATAADELGVTVITFSDEPGIGDVLDVDGTYTTWFDALDVAAVLIRPDFYVLASANDAADVPALLTSYRQLAGRVHDAAAV
jgi:3-(3-hydroxy-phenyl)propionate hydroxylase